MGGDAGGGTEQDRVINVDVLSGRMRPASSGSGGGRRQSAVQVGVTVKTCGLWRSGSSWHVTGHESRGSTGLSWPTGLEVAEDTNRCMFGLVALAVRAGNQRPATSWCLGTWFNIQKCGGRGGGKIRGRSRSRNQKRK